MKPLQSLEKKEDTKKTIVVGCGEQPDNDYIKLLSFLLDAEIQVVVMNDAFLKMKKDNFNFDNIDLLLFTGGSDVSPQMYGENQGKYTKVNAGRDALERALFNVFKGPKTPKLGICRGSQLLTVLNGGKLIQHVEGHGQPHLIHSAYSLPEGHYREYLMSSTHHQMMYPYNLTKDRYKLIAWSKHFLSNVYLNGTNESVELDDEFLEPEIVYYPNTNCLAIQGHPEYEGVPTETLSFVKKLVKKLLYS